MHKSNLPIGIFDSGIGGLTVVEEIIKVLPYESLVYFGDTARLPYGTKSKDVVTKYSVQISDFLIKKRVKIIVVACNTSSSNALSELRKRFSVPIIGVIEPAVKQALKVTKSGRIGVIGTEATINSNAYQNLLRKYGDPSLSLRMRFLTSSKISVYSQACPLFVPLVEEGWTNKPVTLTVAKEYLSGLKRNRIDTLILGCTHYPLIKNVISAVLGKNVVILDSAKATADEVKSLLNKTKLSSLKCNKVKHEFYVSDAPEKFVKLGRKFLKEDVRYVKKIELPF